MKNDSKDRAAGTGELGTRVPYWDRTAGTRQLEGTVRNGYPRQERDNRIARS